jgi:Wall-associated receptor kinase galacturonan-binding
MLAKPGCQEKCGDVDIPYPFGIGANCSLNEEGFTLSCNEYDDKKVPFYFNVELINITLSTAQARMYNQISWQCYNDSTSNYANSSTWYLNFNSTIYRFSYLQNRFTVIGCETLAYNNMYYNSEKLVPYRTGCVSTCYDPGSLTDGSCSGNGCCQTSIPSRINYYEISFDSNFNNSYVWNFSRCSYAVVMATDSFTFKTSYINTSDFLSIHNSTVPIVLDWSIGNDTCKVAQADRSSYACVSNNSECIDSPNGPGYVCNCSGGYEGNPYLLDGCQGQLLSLKYSLFPFYISFVVVDCYCYCLYVVASFLADGLFIYFNFF